eukprot:TCONS_00050240-protein
MNSGKPRKPTGQYDYGDDSSQDTQSYETIDEMELNRLGMGIYPEEFVDDDGYSDEGSSDLSQPMTSQPSSQIKKHSLKMVIKAPPSDPNGKQRKRKKKSKQQTKENDEPPAKLNKKVEKELKEPYYFSDAATTSLLEAYKNCTPLMSSGKYRKKQIWQKIAQDLRCKLVNAGATAFPSSDQCMQRHRTVIKAFKQTKNLNRESGQGRATCKFQDELNDLEGHKPDVVPDYTMASTGEVTRRNSNKDDQEVPSTSASTAQQSTPPPKVKSKPKPKEGRRRNEMVIFMERYEERKAKRDEALMKRKETLHAASMAMMDKLIDKL